MVGFLSLRKITKVFTYCQTLVNPLFIYSKGGSEKRLNNANFHFRSDPTGQIECSIVTVDALLKQVVKRTEITMSSTPWTSFFVLSGPCFTRRVHNFGLVRSVERTMIRFPNPRKNNVNCRGFKTVTFCIFTAQFISLRKTTTISHQKALTFIVACQSYPPGKDHHRL